MATGAAVDEGVFLTGALVSFPVSRMDLTSVLVEIIDSPMLVSMKTIAAIVVIFDRNEAGPRLPKAV